MLAATSRTGGHWQRNYEPETQLQLGFVLLAIPGQLVALSTKLGKPSAIANANANANANAGSTAKRGSTAERRGTAKRGVRMPA